MPTVTLASLQNLREELVNSKYYLNIRSGYMAPVTLHCSYGDSGASITFYVFDGGDELDLTGSVVSLHGIRRDGASYGPFTCRVSGNSVTFTLQAAMTAIEGGGIAELTITKNSTTIGTCNFAVMVEQAVFPNGVAYDSDPSVYQDILIYVQTSMVTEIAARHDADEANEAAIAVERARIDNYLASGTAATNSELIDIRVGADGKTYTTAGESVRTQISNIDSIVTAIHEIDSEHNLFTLTGLQIGKNYAGGSAANRAVVYIPIESNTEYTFKAPNSTAFADVSLIEKAANTGSSSPIVSYTVANGTKKTFTSSATSKYLCIQFNGNSTITNSDFTDYVAYLSVGDGSDMYSAVDTLSRNILENIYEYTNDIFSFDDFRLGVNYTGGAAANRAVVYIHVEASTEYTFIAPESLVLNDISIIEKAANTGASSAIATYTVQNKSKKEFVTSPTTHYVCIQFNGKAVLTSSDFTNYTPHLLESIYVNNIFTLDNLQVGQNYAGGSADNRAVVYIPVESITEYTFITPASVVLNDVSIIEKAANYGSSPPINVYTVSNNSRETFTTTARTEYVCIQFNGANTLSTTDFNGYKAYLLEGKQTKANNPISAVDTVAREGLIITHETFRDLAETERVGLSRVGGYEYRSVSKNLHYLTHVQNAHPDAYFDVNSTVKQYTAANYPKQIVPEYIFNNLEHEEIDFTPSNNGFTRVVVGKNSDDVFFIEYVASDRLGAFGNPAYDSLEITTDFVHFTTILRSDALSFGDGIPLTGMTNIKVNSVKEFANGDYIVAIQCNNISDNTNYTYFYKLNHDFTNITLCTYENFDGNVVPMIDEFGNAVYDWSIFVYGTKAIATTYGSRNPSTDYGRVWYTEDCGSTWKQVFQTNNHLQEGQASGVVVPGAHTHGVMIDPYTNYLFVLVGEENSNIFYNTHGMDATDTNWSILPIRQQPFYNFQTFTQVVTGYPFKDGLVFGSDNEGVGCVYRINKLDDGSFSTIESVHEILPNSFNGTFYCFAEISKRDASSPLLMCVTRENAMLTESANEQLNSQHRARIIATYDGVNFTEVWIDNTYGNHETYIDNAVTTRNFAYCTRGMQCYLLKDNSAVIKYSGRDYYYFGGNPMYSVSGKSNASCKVQIIKNAGAYL